MIKKSSQIFSRGFTLIELLVVIAIIGILSAVVLTTLNLARSRGSDAGIKSNLAGVRAQAEIMYDTNNNYTGVCANPNVAAQVTAANVAAGVVAAVSNNLATPASATQSVCHETASAWAANVVLKTDTTKSWCVDSSGASKQINGFLGASATVCP